MAEEEFDYNPNHFPLVEAARLLHQADDDLEALELIKKAMKRNPDVNGVHLLAGEIYQALADMDNAEKCLRHGLELNPDHTWALKSLGVFLASRQIHPAETVELLIHYLKKRGWDDYQALSLLAGIPVDRAEKQKVIDSLKQAWASTLSPAIGLLCATQMRLHGRVEEAWQIMDLLVINSSSHSNYNVCGIIHYQLGNFDLAVVMYQKAIKNIEIEWESNPDFWPEEEYGNNLNNSKAIYKSNLSGCYLAIKKYDEALVEAEDALELNPRYGYHWKAKVNALNALKQSQEAADVAGIALENDRKSSFLDQTDRENLLLLRAQSLRSVSSNLEPDFLDDKRPSYGKYYGHAEKLIGFNNYKAAEKMIKKALKRETQESGFLEQSEKDALSRLELLINDNRQLQKKCLPVCLEGVQTYPKNHNFYFLAAHIYEELGEFAKALKMFEGGFRAILELLPVGSESGVRSIDLYGFEVDDYYILLHKAGKYDVAWERYKQYSGEMSQEFSLSFESTIFNMFAGFEDGPVAQIIEQIYQYQPDFPQSIDLMCMLRFKQGRLNDYILIVQRGINSLLSNKYRVRFLNNLGYVQILLGKFEDAKETLERALNLDEYSQDVELEKKFKSSFAIGLGVAFFLDDKVLSFDWFDKSKIFSVTPVYFWQPEKAIEAVKINLATLAMVVGDVVEANALIIEILCLPEEQEVDLKLRFIGLLFIARFRNDLKTARFAWSKYLRCLEKSYEEEQELFKQNHPSLYAWLNKAV